MFFQEYFADFERDFRVLDESGTNDDRELCDFDPKLNLTLTALLRKVPILYRIGKNIQPLTHVGKKISRMTRVKNSRKLDSSAFIT